MFNIFNTIVLICDQVIMLLSSLASPAVIVRTAFQENTTFVAMSSSVLRHRTTGLSVDSTVRTHSSAISKLR